ncbi:MAG: hydroxymethylglutaryl-CoA synthase [Pseudomonadota bacterium]
MKIGIDCLSFYVPNQYLSLETLANHQNIDPEKYFQGLGQEKIAVPAHDEDVVTLAAEAAKPVIEKCGTEGIDTLLFATESGIDQSKAAGVYVHRLLGLPQNCRNVELKQACYSATAALQLACGHIARKPDRKVLIVASDISRYDLDSAAEATQGSGAVAMLVSANPRVLEIEAATGCFTEDVMDFWRPNYRKTPLVDGKYSTLKYTYALAHAWEDYQANDGREYAELKQFCYHIPFTRMGSKAHQQLAKLHGLAAESDKLESGLTYARQIGNCYAASLYLSVISMLECCEEDLSGEPVGLFSYGSGAVAEFFSGVVQPGYREHLLTEHHKAVLAERNPLSYEAYRHLWFAPDPQDGSTFVIDRDRGPCARGQFKLTKIDEHKRHYANERNGVGGEQDCEQDAGRASEGEIGVKASDNKLVESLGLKSHVNPDTQATEDANPVLSRAGSEETVQDINGVSA